MLHQRISLAVADDGRYTGPSGFPAPSSAPLVQRVCTDCGKPSSIQTFAGDSVCPPCAGRRANLALSLHAAVLGFTPEDISTWIVDGYPDEVMESIGRPHELREAIDHVALLLCRSR